VDSIANYRLEKQLSIQISGTAMLRSPNTASSAWRSGLLRRKNYPLPSSYLHGECILMGILLPSNKRALLSSLRVVL
jgi:hypothetical protein